MENIGLQLYSIKELTEKDFLGTLEKVAKVGYDGVEFAGYFNTPAKELRKALDQLGLKAAGSHIGVEEIKKDIHALIDFSHEIGSPYIICPGLPVDMCDSADAYKRTADYFNQVGRTCKENGIRFGYHNHAGEFQKYEGEYGLDLLMNNTEKDLLFVELDTFWVEYAGLRSVDFIDKYGERCAVLHIKDMKSPGDEKNIEIGKGVMDFKAITAAGKKVGANWYTVEQEYFEIDQIKSIEESLHYLREIL